MTEHIVQALIMILSGSAIWLLSSRTRKVQIAGCIVGLVGQPLWFWTTLKNNQWGVFVLSAVFAVSYGRGLYTRWRKIDE